MSGIVIFGVDALDRKFAALETKLQKKLLRPALRDGTKMMQGLIRQAAPRRSGALAASLRVRALKRSRKRIGFMVRTLDKATADKRNAKAAAKLGPQKRKRRPSGAFRGETFYGKFSELGTRHQRPQKWMRNTLYSNRQACINVVIQGCRARIAGLVQ